MIHLRTWIEKDAAGWYCVCGFWTEVKPEDVGTAGSEPEDSIRVGPFESCQVARKELRGDFRKVVMRGIQNLNQRHGGRVVAQAWGDGSGGG